MNRAIWRKAVSDAWLQLVISCVILVAFSWVFVWLMSQLPTKAFGKILTWLPDWVGSMIGVPLHLLGSPAGQLSLLYVHVVTMLVCVGWAVGRGSDSISGEIGRGTMDLILSLPLRRASVVVAPAVVAAIGGAVLSAAILLGTCIGLHTVDFSKDVSLRQFLPGAVNLCCMIFCLTGITALISSWNRSRWRTISLAVGVYVTNVIVEMVGRVWQWGSWLRYCSFSTAFQPHVLILDPDSSGRLAMQYNGTLVGLGLAAYVVAVIVLTYRDIPSAR
ncbi:MAG: ABC transporter permease subunit [Pirellulales bacterium]|nr:ABC transporter permease subunit [Pirellulales bacterium]